MINRRVNVARNVTVLGSNSFNYAHLFCFFVSDSCLIAKQVVDVLQKNVWVAIYNRIMIM